MTTQAQTQTTDAIPPWFLAFAEENARQHAELADRVAEARLETAELRSETIAKFGELEAKMHREFVSQLRWVVGTISGAGIAVAGSLIYAAERLAA